MRTREVYLPNMQHDVKWQLAPKAPITRISKLRRFPSDLRFSSTRFAVAFFLVTKEQICDSVEGVEADRQKSDQALKSV